MCWILPKINMNQPKVYLCPLPPEPPSYRILSHPSRLSQSTSLSSLSYIANSHWLIILHMVVYLFPCNSFHSSHPFLPPQPMSTNLSLCMFLAWKNQYYENEYTSKSNLQIQCNPYQITNDIFHRTRTKNFHSILQKKPEQTFWPTPYLAAGNR